MIIMSFIYPFKIYYQGADFVYPQEIDAYYFKKCSFHYLISNYICFVQLGLMIANEEEQKSTSF